MKKTTKQTVKTNKITEEEKKYINGEQRQIISISKDADLTLRDDCIRFGCSKSTLLNTVILNYWDQSAAAINSYLKSRHGYYSSILGVSESSSHIKTEKEDILCYAVDRIVEHEERIRIQKLTTYPKEVKINFRLKNDVAELPRDNEDFRTEYVYHGNSRSNFIKAIIEEYARLTLYRRYKIFFAETIEKTNNMYKAWENSVYELFFRDKTRPHWFIIPLGITEESRTKNGPLFLCKTCFEGFCRHFVDAAVKIEDIDHFRKVPETRRKVNLDDKTRLSIFRKLEAVTPESFLSHYNYFMLLLNGDTLKLLRDIEALRPRALSEEEIAEVFTPKVFERIKGLKESKDNPYCKMFYCPSIQFKTYCDMIKVKKNKIPVFYNCDPKAQNPFSTSSTFFDKLPSITPEELLKMPIILKR